MCSTPISGPSSTRSTPWCCTWCRPVTGPVQRPDAAVDLDGVYVPHMREAGHVVALIRPDHYLFGAASAMTDLSGLVDDLRLQMTAAHPAPVATIPIPYTKGRRS